MGVAIAKPHPYVLNNAFLGTWRPHTYFLLAWSLINFFPSQNNFQWVWLWKKNTHYHAHMCLIMLTQVLGECMPNFGLFSAECLAVNPRHTYGPKYISKCFRRSNPFDSSIIQKFIFLVYFFILYTNGKRCSQEGSHPCYSQSLVVYAYHVLSLLLQGFVWPKHHFWSDIKQKWVWSYILYI